MTRDANGNNISTKERFSHCKMIFLDQLRQCVRWLCNSRLPVFPSSSASRNRFANPQSTTNTCVVCRLTSTTNEKPFGSGRLRYPDISNVTRKFVPHLNLASKFQIQNQIQIPSAPQELPVPEGSRDQKIRFRLASVRIGGASLPNNREPETKTVDANPSLLAHTQRKPSK